MPIIYGNDPRSGRIHRVQQPLYKSKELTENELALESFKESNNRSMVPVVMDGKVYPSIKAACDSSMYLDYAQVCKKIKPGTTVINGYTFYRPED